MPEGPTPESENPLDRWVLARLNQVVERVTDALENSDSFAATLVVEPFIDDLTNWYVRRSRRRYWKSEHDTDKNTAYATLYHVLVKLVKLLAPFVPFVTEVMYQNLVRSVSEQAYESVHHCSWPQTDRGALDDTLVEQMDLARRIASLGLSARSGANLKVRQPLGKVLVHIKEGADNLPEFLVDIVRDELNVKAFELVSRADQLVTYHVLPVNKLLGPRFGASFPAVRKALEALDPAEVNRKVTLGESIAMQVDGEDVELLPTEVLVETQPLEGLAVASEKAVTVAVDAVITPVLRAEGLAREVVRRVQSMRKDADYDISDRIKVYYQASPSLAEAVEAHRAYIMGEVLAVELNQAAPPEGAFKPGEPFVFDGEELVVGILR